MYFTRTRGNDTAYKEKVTLCKLDERTIAVDASELTTDTVYTFNITDGLKNVSGKSVAPSGYTSKLYNTLISPVAYKERVDNIRIPYSDVKVYDGELREDKLLPELSDNKMTDSYIPIPNNKDGTTDDFLIVDLGDYYKVSGIMVSLKDASSTTEISKYLYRLTVKGAKNPTISYEEADTLLNGGDVEQLNYKSKPALAWDNETYYRYLYIRDDQNSMNNVGELIFYAVEDFVPKTRVVALDFVDEMGKSIQYSHNKENTPTVKAVIKSGEMSEIITIMVCEYADDGRFVGMTKTDVDSYNIPIHENGSYSISLPLKSSSGAVSAYVWNDTAQPMLKNITSSEL